MYRYKFKIIIFSLVIIGLSIPSQGQNKSSPDIEYKLKAAFLYNFIKFVDWPEKIFPDEKGKILIGIIGKNNFGNAFEPVKDKKVKGREVEIRYYNSIIELKKNKDELEIAAAELRKCHLLFVSSSEKDFITDIINIVKGKNVLTVGEVPDFLDSGGIINFILEENKVRFEINLIAARKSKLTIRSQLLRLAKKVIDDESK